MDRIAGGRRREENAFIRRCLWHQKIARKTVGFVCIDTFVYRVSPSKKESAVCFVFPTWAPVEM